MGGAMRNNCAVAALCGAAVLCVMGIATATSSASAITCSDLVPPPTTGGAYSGKPWPPSATSMRLQGIVAVSRFDRKIPVALGEQYGMYWLGSTGDTLEVGLAPGPMSVSAAQDAIDSIIKSSVSDADFAFAEPLVQVVAVPFSYYKLLADEKRLFAQLVAATPSGAPAIGLGISGATGDPTGAPRLVVWLNNLARDKDCAAAQSIVQQYGAEAVLIWMNIGPPQLLSGPHHHPPARPKAHSKRARRRVPAHRRPSKHAQVRHPHKH